jgi:hypothetical protein
MDTIDVKSFCSAVWRWHTAAAAGAANARQEWQVVMRIAEKLGLTSKEQVVELAEEVISRKPKGYPIKFVIRSLLRTLAGGGGGAAGGAETGAVLLGAEGLILLAALAALVAVAGAGFYVALANHRDRMRTDQTALHLYEQYLIRHTRFQSSFLTHHPTRRPDAPMLFEEWMAHQGTGITVL